MEFPTLSMADFADLSFSIPFNVTLSDDSMRVSSKSNETNTYTTRDSTSLIIAVCITALYSLICVVGLLGNVLVMYGVVR